MNPNALSTTQSPIQKFRWVHFPRNAELTGDFVYRVTPVFMNALDELSYGEPQEAAIELRRETYPGKLNVTFTRGFVSSQAFVDRYESAGHDLDAAAGEADHGLTFVPTHPKAEEALAWMGFEARSAILEVLDQAIADTKAQVRVVAYDLNEPERRLAPREARRRLRSSSTTAARMASPDSAETQAAKRGSRRRPARQTSGGSTWASCSTTRRSSSTGPRCRRASAARRTSRGAASSCSPTTPSCCAARRPVKRVHGGVRRLLGEQRASPVSARPPSAKWTRPGLAGIDARVAFSPHASEEALLAAVGG